tara:strand:+ start:85030 stop:85464 length:435 start_codon:yes stop_codon:yes gene_type:complete
VSYKPEQDIIFNTITSPLGDELTWRWDDKLSTLLTEFSWEKKDQILLILRQLFTEEWSNKNIKKSPQAIKDELGELAKLTKEQLIFTRPATVDTPALAILWWPWGHGATYSIRIKILSVNYDDIALQQAQKSLMSKFFQRLTSR